jgi:hypothetical protein
VSAITDLFAQYSFETIILFIVTIGVVIKYVAEVIEWFYKKIENHFNDKKKEAKNMQDTLSSIQLVQDKFTTIDNKLDVLNTNITELAEKSDRNTERLQEQTRSIIIDKHHHFCYELGEIDDISLQSLERQFLYYKSAGGDTYIDNLMEELRRLPVMYQKRLQTLKKNTDFSEEQPTIYRNPQNDERGGEE